MEDRGAIQRKCTFISQRGTCPHGDVHCWINIAWKRRRVTRAHLTSARLFRSGRTPVRVATSHTWSESSGIRVQGANMNGNTKARSTLTLAVTRCVEKSKSRKETCGGRNICFIMYATSSGMRASGAGGVRGTRGVAEVGRTKTHWMCNCLGFVGTVGAV